MTDTLDSFLAEAWTADPPTGTLGSETEWLPFCTLSLQGPQLLVIDADFAPAAEDGILVDLPSGRYNVSARVLDYGADKRVSRLRVAREGASVRLGDLLGTTWTDTAKTGVCDYHAYLDAWGADNEAAWTIVGPTLENAGTHGIAVLDEARGAVLPFVSSGFGDGEFPVYELLDEASGARVGVQIEFMPPDLPYPF